MGTFKKGDIVVVKDWDEMAQKYGYTSRNKQAIDCRFRFVREMRHLCGELASVTKETNGGQIYLKFLEEKPGIKYSWVFSSDMLHLYEGDDDQDTLANESALIDFIMG